MSDFEKTIKITGITCDACVRLIQKRVGGIKGVTDVVVNKDTGETKIFANRDLSKEDIEYVLADTEYKISY